MRQILITGIIVSTLVILMLAVSGDTKDVLVKIEESASSAPDKPEIFNELSFETDEDVYGNVIVHGGDYRLTFSIEEIDSLESEIMKRLNINSNQPFDKYFISSEEAGMFLGPEYTPLMIYQGKEGILILLAENTKMKSIKANYPGKTSLSSQEELVLDGILQGLFGDREQEVYIPADYNKFDRYPIPPLIVPKQEGMAVSYKDIGDRKYLAIGFDTDPLTNNNAYDNMENIIKLYALFRPGGVRTLTDFSPDQEPTTGPTPEPTVSPTVSPTISPTVSPTDGPTPVPEYSNTIVIPLMALLIYGFLTVKRKNND